jgi:CYTH domain-containing protein
MALRHGSVLAKTRFQVAYAGRRWELDVYSGENEGLLIAEIELESGADIVELPTWLGREVTGEARYYASRLARNPFRSWAPDPKHQDRRTGGSG